MTLALLRITLIAAVGWAVAAGPAQAQATVANYAFGRPGTAAYEHFSLWVKDGRRADLSYAYGPARRKFRLRYLGPSRVSGQPGFKVQFSNGHTLYLTPSGTTLGVATSPTAPTKTFAWEYEGPVNGIGTFCSVCAEDEKAALRVVRTYYLK